MEPIIVAPLSQIEAMIERAVARRIAPVLQAVQGTATPVPGDHLTGRQLAARLGVAVRSLEDYRRRGMPAHTFPGVRGYRYVLSEVEEWVASGGAKRPAIRASSAAASISPR